MIIEPIKDRISQIFLLHREVTVIAQISDSVEDPEGVACAFIQVTDRKPQEHVESEFMQCRPNGPRISCGDLPVWTLSYIPLT